MSFGSIEEIMEYMEDVNPSAQYPTDLVESIVGVVECGGDPQFLVDRDKCIEIFQNRDGMSYEEAEEFFEYNVAGSKGENMPVYTILLKEE